MKRALNALHRLANNVIDTPAVILIYHRVTDLKQDPQLLAVSPANFDAQVRHLKSNYNLLEVEEFKEIRLKKKPMPKRSVVVTFDDGYADNFLEAIPILERHKAQALFYISTSLIGTRRELWWDDLERIFLGEHSLPAKLELGTEAFATSSASERRSAYDQLHSIIKNSVNQERSQLLDYIVNWSGMPADGRETHRMLTQEELRKLSDSPSAVIGAHTHTHPKLSVCTPAEQKAEISQSKEILESALQKRITHFSYPFGTSADFTIDTVAICKEIGFQMVCANNYGQVHSWNDMFTMPRILVRDWEEEVFGQRMRKFFTY